MENVYSGAAYIKKLKSSLLQGLTAHSIQGTLQNTWLSENIIESVTQHNV